MQGVEHSIEVRTKKIRAVTHANNQSNLAVNELEQEIFFIT